MEAQRRVCPFPRTDVLEKILDGRISRVVRQVNKGDPNIGTGHPLTSIPGGPCAPPPKATS